MLMASSTERLDASYGRVRKRPWDRFTTKIPNPVKKLRVWLSTFDTAEDATMAYDATVISLRGHKAKTNFTYYSSSSAKQSASKLNTSSALMPRVVFSCQNPSAKMMFLGFTPSMDSLKQLSERYEKKYI
ncbi:hypothetical protein KI387_010185, partial [Taxus chinensis]